ncbi:MAG: hypothetical protein QOG58_6203 [Caballeronia sp.]|nr:hypothetical protein [Caballeronia sp.]
MNQYLASCHCGRVKFSLEADIDELIACDCSLCMKRNALMVTVAHDKLKIMSGEDALSLYQWNTGKARHYFCSTCGIYTCHRRRSDVNVFSVNVFCIQGIDPTRIPVRHVDGKSRSVVQAG